jgi:hypothetical protein
VCLTGRHVGKETLQIQDAGRFPLRLNPVRRSSLCLPLVAFSSSKDTLFGVCTFLQPRLQRKGAKGFLRATKGV